MLGAAALRSSEETYRTCEKTCCEALVLDRVRSSGVA